jgi:predicted dienelactone hydrolase
MSIHTRCLRRGWLMSLVACFSVLLFAAEASAGGVFPPVSSFSARGPFATVVETPAGVACTIHRPATLGQNGVTHPVILWGNGTGASPSTYSALLSHWASHGFIVAAANSSNAGNGSQMITCLNFVLTQNNNSSSVFFRRVDPARIGTSGHSQGGAGAVMAGRDARVTATAPVQPYIRFIPGGGLFDSRSIGQQHAPMFLVSGSADSIATPRTHQEPIFENVPVFVAWGTRIGANHFEAIGNAGNFRGPLTAWFRSELMDDTSAARVFDEPCTLCSDPGWDVLFNND